MFNDPGEVLIDEMDRVIDEGYMKIQMNQKVMSQKRKNKIKKMFQRPVLLLLLTSRQAIFHVIFFIENLVFATTRVI